MSDLPAIKEPSIAKPALAPSFDVLVHRDLSAVEAVWKALEQRGTLTPYQRFAWIEALLAADAEPIGRLAVAVIRRADRVVALLPLQLVRKGGLVRAHIVGSRQSNADWLLADRGFAPSRAELLQIFSRISLATGGIDLLSLTNLPRAWQDQPNPLLALDHFPAASNLYRATVGPTPVPYIDHRLSAKRRSNIKRGRRRLEEQFGPVRLVRVRDAATLDAVHIAFLEQRGTRFAEMGLDNMFAAPPFLALFRDLTVAGFAQAQPPLVAHALYAGDAIVATSWGLQSASHYSQYINSTASGPAAKYSLMGILVGELMDDLTTSGITTFDMGLGDFDYKVEWTAPEPVFNALVALTLKGRLVAGGTALRDAGKRMIKQTPVLWRLAQAVRRVLYRLRGHTA